MKEDELDLVYELRTWATLLDEATGRAQVTFMSGCVFTDAANEIERLRAELKAAQDTAAFWERECHRG